MLNLCSKLYVVVFGGTCPPITLVMVEVVLLGTLMYWEDYELHVHIDVLIIR